MDLVEKANELAEAIAYKGEGFGPPENLPTRCNNPGDLELGDVGYGVDAGKTIYANLVDGWDAIDNECLLMLSGQQSLHHSHIYNPTMTFLEVAEKYTGDDNAAQWASAVS